MKLTKEEAEEWIDNLMASKLFKLAQASLIKQKKYKKVMVHGVELRKLEVWAVVIEGLRLMTYMTKENLLKRFKKGE